MDSGPKPSDEEFHKVALFFTRALSSLVPGGTIAAEFAALFITDPANARRDKMIAELAAGLASLNQRGLVSVDDLRRSEEVSAILLQAIHSAMRSFGEKKMHAVKIAALNGAAHKADERYLSMVVLGILDRLTDAHISLLLEFDERADPKRRRMPTIEVGMLGISLRKSIEGMAEPENLSFGDAQGFVERREIDVNALIVGDLISQGLLANYFEAVEGSIYSWSPDPNMNGTDFISLTRTGKLLLQEIRAAPR